MWAAIARAIASAFARMKNSGPWKWTGQFLTDAWDQTVEIAAMPFEYGGRGLEWIGSKLGGGGGPAPARDMSKLPTASELRDVQEAAQHHEAARVIAADTAVEQVKRFAEADGPARLTMPLTKLKMEQAEWLMSLSENAYIRLLEAPDRRIQECLDGRPGIIPGLMSVGEKPEELSPLALRIKAYRDRKIDEELDEWRTAREVNHIRAA